MIFTLYVMAYVYVGVGVYIYVCGCACMCECVQARGWCWVSFSVALHCIWGSNRAFQWTWTAWILPSDSVPSALGWQTCAAMLRCLHRFQGCRLSSHLTQQVFYERAHFLSPDFDLFLCVHVCAYLHMCLWKPEDKVRSHLPQCFIVSLNDL